MRMPRFQEPSTYIRFQGAQLDWPTLRGREATGPLFLRLKNREAPMKYPFTFTAQAPGVVSNLQTMADFEANPNHVYQFFAGVSWGGRVRFYLPLDNRLLKWDQQSLAIQERDTANIEYEDAPIDAPSHEFWVAPTENYVPAFDVENVFTNVRPTPTIDIHMLFLAAKFSYEFVNPAKEPDIHDKLVRFQIPSKFVTFGGRVE